MKTKPKTRNTPASTSPSSTPFFSRKNDQKPFFLSQEEANFPFFSPAVIQTKVADGQPDDNDGIEAHTEGEKTSRKLAPSQDILSGSEASIQKIPQQQLGSIIQRIPEHYTVQTSQRAIPRIEPGTSIPRAENFVDRNPISYVYDIGTDLSLISSEGDWLKVRGIAIPANAANGSSSVRIIEGWISRSETNLTPRTDTPAEHDAIAQDLDDMMHEKILPAMLQWEVGVRTQGQAYARAHQTFSAAVERAGQEAAARASFYAAALTIVSVGALGWMGEVAIAGESVARMMSSAARGAIEDAIQTGIGEGIDIVQGGWFSRHVTSSTHPINYLNEALTALTATKRELIQHIGQTQSRIRRSSTPINRPNLLVSIYQWWSDAQVRNSPNIRTSQENAMAEEFERAFWAQYIRETLTYQHLISHGGRVGRTFYHPESAVRDRLDHLGITRAANISEWPAWYVPTDTRGTRESHDNTIAIGSHQTEKLHLWATTYTPNTFS